LNTKFVDKNKTPDFTSIYEKIRDQWPAFVAYKKSEKARKTSQQNKLNAAKKKYHHVTGSGGYSQAEPKWKKMENDLLAKGVEPVSLKWPDQVRTWVFENGGALDPETGECVYADHKLAIPIERIEKAIKEIVEGRFHPDREKDVLTKALGNPEHPGRTRGTPCSIPWVHGFRGSRDTYRSRGRKKKEEASQLQQMEQRLAALEASVSQRALGPPSQQHDPSLEATPPSQRRSSVASTEHVRPDITARHYLVDGITENEHYVVLIDYGNLSLEVVKGSVRHPRPDAPFHCAPIPDGYAVVMVDEITPGLGSLQLESSYR
jgi:hypothetical protein